MLFSRIIKYSYSPAASSRAASRKRSLKPSDRSPWKMHGSAHGGPTGWFNHNRLSQKRRSRLSNSPVPRSLLAASSASSPTVVGVSPREPLLESSKAAIPTADVSDASQENAVAQGKVSLLSPPLQSPGSDKSNLVGPIVQGVTSDVAPTVQGSQQLTQSPGPRAVVEEGNAPSEATITEVCSFVILGHLHEFSQSPSHRYTSPMMTMVEVIRHPPMNPRLHHWVLLFRRSSEMRQTRTRAGM